MSLILSAFHLSAAEVQVRAVNNGEFLNGKSALMVFERYSK
jgi:hypothetical protein